jgi:hypothetical protein
MPPPAAFRRLPADPLPDAGGPGRYFPLTGRDGPR